MIGDYIHLLYTNCPALVKTNEYNPVTLREHFNTAVKNCSSQAGFAEEKDLVQHVLSTGYNELSPLFDNCSSVHIFYLVNSLSEYKHYTENSDELGRYYFERSVQKQTGITNNLVLELMKRSVQNDAVLKQNFKIVQHNSFFFLSHDIDSLYGSTLQDGLWALKNKRFDVLLMIFTNVLMTRPHWFNIDKIMQLESEYDFKSTFYWLVNKGKIDQRQTNSDYSISSYPLKRTLRQVKENGFENGLHKSISGDSFKTELARLPEQVPGNRYHYLKYQLPKAYSDIEAAGLKLDASLGFAEHFGFRNNYGYPFSPCNIETGKPYAFIEVPLNCMDGTFQRYMKLPVDKTAGAVIGFLDQHRYNCLISVLWHNTFFTNYKYKGYREEYVKILRYLYEEKFTNINQSGIIELFSWKN